MGSRCQRVVSLLGWTAVGALSLLPAAVLLGQSLVRDGELSLAAYGRLMDARVAGLFVRSGALGLLATAVALGLGGAAAAIIETRQASCRTLLRATAITPLLLPPFVQVLAWERLLPAGSLRLSLLAGGLLLGIAFSPLGFFFVSQGLRSVSAELVDAARVSLPRLALWRRVILPLASPSIGAGAALIFVLAFLNFEIPDLLELAAYPVEITLAESAGDPGAAFALASPGILLVGCALWALYRWSRGRGFAISGRETASSLRCGRPGMLEWCFLALWWGGAVLLPVFALGSQVGGWEVARKAYLDSRRELFLGTLLPLGSAALAVALAGLLASRGPPGRLSLLLWAPFALPGALLGFAVLSIWNRQFLDVVYDTPLLVVAGGAARFFPLAYFAVAAHRRSLQPELWEAHDLVGGGAAGAARRTLRLWWPLSAPGLTLGLAAVFLIQSGELPLALELQHPSLTPLTVRIYGLIHFYREGEAAALCLFQLAAALAVSAGIFLAARLADPSRDDAPS
jgi:iron(III) transport system permease protein